MKSNKFKVGDRVVDPLFRGAGRIVVSSDQMNNKYCGVTFDDYLYDTPGTGWHSMYEPDLVAEEVYNSPLYKALK